MSLRKLGLLCIAITLTVSIVSPSACLAERVRRMPAPSSGSESTDVIREERIRARMEAAVPWLGIAFKETAADSRARGLEVESVAAGSPAEQAGVRSGDIISQIGGKTVTNAKDFMQLVLGLKIGTDYPLTVIRDGKTLELTIRSASRPAGRFGSASTANIEDVSDKPAPRKGLLDINVLKYAFIDPKTRAVTFVGKYDPTYNTGPIPYADYLKVALENPYPSFSLDPPQETAEALKTAAKVLDAEIARMDDLEYASQWAQKVSNLLLEDPSLEVDRARFFKHCAEVLGITGDELRRMHDAATGKIDIPGTEFMGLASKMIRGIGLTKAGDALGVLAAGGTPEELLFKMAEKLGLSDQYTALVMKGLPPEEFRKEEIILCISEVCRQFEAPESEINSIVASIRGGQSADLIINYMGKQLSNYITNKSGRKMINGLILGPAVLARLYNLPIPKAELVFKGLPADSLLGDVFFKSDYRLKSLSTYPDARDRVAAHLTHQEFMQRHLPAAVLKALSGVDVLAGQRLVPAEVAMHVSPAGDVVEFGDSKIKIVGWIIEMMRPADKATIDTLSDCISKYSNFLAEHYDDYARVYPEWHKLSEAAKVIALARWAKNNGYTLRVIGESGEKVSLPKYINGFWSAVFEVYEDSQYLNFIAEGGASFAKDEGEDWLKVQQDVSVTSSVSKQLVASAIFAEQALGAAVSGDLESARELAEKSARAMTGEIDLTRLPPLDNIPVPADPASYAAATREAIDEAAECFDKMVAAGKDIEKAEQLAATAPDEAAKLKEQAVKVRDEAQAKLNQILEQVKNYKSDPTQSGEALIVLQSDSAVVMPIASGGSAASSGTSAPGTTGAPGTGAQPTATASTKPTPEDLERLKKELDEVNKQIAATREALLRLNKYIQSNQKLFEEWESSASEAFDRCVSMIGDIALDFGIGGLSERYETIYELAKKLPGKPEDVIEKYRYLASLTRRLREAKAVNDFAGLAERENKTEAEIWETLRDGIGQISGLLGLDDTLPGKWWKYGSLAIDTAYNLAELRMTWKNLKALEESTDRYAEAVSKLAAKMKELVDRQKEIKQKIEAGGEVEKIAN